MGTLVTLFLQLAENFLFLLVPRTYIAPKRKAISCFTQTALSKPTAFTSFVLTIQKKHGSKILYKATKIKTRYYLACKRGKLVVGHFRRQSAKPAKKPEHTYNKWLRHAS